MDTQSDKGEASQPSGRTPGSATAATNILLLILIAALLVDMYIRLSPRRDLAPDPGIPKPNVSSTAPGGQQGSNYLKNNTNQPVVKISPEAIPNKPGTQPKQIFDRIPPSP